MSSTDPDSRTEPGPADQLLEAAVRFDVTGSELRSIPLPSEFQAVVDAADAANRVNSSLPKFMNPLLRFRTQGGINMLALQALNSIAKSLTALSEEIGSRDRLIEKLVGHINAQNANNERNQRRLLDVFRRLEQRLDQHEASVERRNQQLKLEIAALQSNLAGLASVTDLIDSRLTETDSRLDPRLLASVQDRLAGHEPQLATLTAQFAALQISQNAALAKFAHAEGASASIRHDLEQNLAAAEQRLQAEIGQLSQIQTVSSQESLVVANTLRTDLEQHLAAVERRHQAEVAQLAQQVAEARAATSRQTQDAESAFRTEIGELRSEQAVLRHNQRSFLRRWDSAPDTTTKEAPGHDDRSNQVAKVRSLISTEQQLETDAMYLAFENRFRGPTEMIKERLKVNIDVLTRAMVQAPAAPGIRWPDQAEAPIYKIVDLASGRGEWLQVMAEQGHRALGVDLNTYFIANCQELGLAIVESDVVTFLRTLPDNCLALVSAFHIIEHLPLARMLELISETYRVLVKGGTALFETPNCKNLTVGAANFYCDPTHRNPVFPETAQFLFRQQGFAAAVIDYRLPVDGSPFDQTKPDQAALHGWFYGPRDYAVIATK
jgi:SAM-dependent methyltransferase